MKKLMVMVAVAAVAVGAFAGPCGPGGGRGCGGGGSVLPRHGRGLFANGRDPARGRAAAGRGESARGDNGHADAERVGRRPLRRHNPGQRLGSADMESRPLRDKNGHGKIGLMSERSLQFRTTRTSKLSSERENNLEVHRKSE